MKRKCTAKCLSHFIFLLSRVLENSDGGLDDSKSELSRQGGAVANRVYEIGQEVYVLMGHDWRRGTIVENEDDSKYSTNYRVRIGTGNRTQVRHFWPSHVRVMNEQ